tara:strand:- start:73 stop:342 length:270 start_codon:yes stop_codon:yes gene_type:complete
MYICRLLAGMGLERSLSFLTGLLAITSAPTLTLYPHFYHRYFYNPIKIRGLAVNIHTMLVLVALRRGKKRHGSNEFSSNHPIIDQKITA